MFLVLFAAGNMYLKKATGGTLFDYLNEAKRIVRESTPEDFRMSEMSYIYSDNGTELAGLSEDIDATYLSYDEIPSDVINAFVAVEDRTFWKNGGIDYKGILRVCLNYVKTKGEVAEGASTITQQLARGVFLTNEKTMSRKFKEIFIARELTKKYSKEQIMEFYCNTCCFANGIYGVEDASQSYFGLPVEDLSLSQAAYICAIPNRPEYYNPRNDSSNALQRRDKILEDMYECGYITKAAYEDGVQEKMAVVEKEEEEDFYNYEVTYAINCAVRYLMKLDGFEFEYKFKTDEDYKQYYELYDEAYKQAKHKLYTGGYKITTTMNLDAQKKLQKVLDDNLAFSDAKNEKTGVYNLQGAMTVLDNKTGKVVAIIGGREQEELKQTYSLNRAFQAYRQPGSSFKPLAVYTPALNDGFTATSRLKEINVSAAKNSTSEKISAMSGRSVSLRYAVEQSLNGCAYWLFNTLGPRSGLSYVTDMNFAKIVPSDYTLSASLGGLTEGVTTVEMANAYNTLENHGEYTQTDCIESIVDSDGNEIYEEPESRQVYSEEAADNMTDIMMGVLRTGTAKGLKWSSASDVDAAAKTGTTNDKKDGWFCGFTPYYTIAVWVGCDTPTAMANLWGNTYPAYIWKDAMLSMLEGLPAAEFDIQKSYSDSSYSTPKADDEDDADKDKDKKDDNEGDKDKEPADVDKPVDKPDKNEPADTTDEPDDIGGGDIDQPDNPDNNEPGKDEPGTDEPGGGGDHNHQPDDGGESGGGTDNSADTAPKTE